MTKWKAAKLTDKIMDTQSSQLSRGAPLENNTYTPGFCFTSPQFSVTNHRCFHRRKVSPVAPEMKMPIDFYQLPGSAPCRAVALTAAAVGVEMNFKEVALMKGDHLKPEFLKMNPQHTIPTIDDNGFYLWESRAIMGYLADQYGKNDTLYPKDPKKRAIVNQKLYFDACTLYKAFADCYYPIFFAKEAKNPAKVSSVDAALTFLDKFLEGQDYVAGKSMTLADLSIVATVSTIEIVGHDIKAHKNIARWYAKIKSEAPKYEEYNGAGVKVFKALIDEMMKK
ncbi:Glutathione S-transferase 1, isoform C [Anthophora plagiata]